MCRVHTFLVCFFLLRIFLFVLSKSIFVSVGWGKRLSEAGNAVLGIRIWAVMPICVLIHILLLERPLNFFLFFPRRQFYNLLGTVTLDVMTRCLLTIPFFALFVLI